MATIGNVSISYQAFGFYGLNASDTLAIQITMPQSGQITDITAYFAGHGQTITARMCVWDANRTLVTQTADFSVVAGSGGNSGQYLWTRSLTTPYNASAGQVLYIGFWRHANQSDEWTEQNGGTEYQYTSGSNTSPPSGQTWNTASGTPQIYATYTPTSIPSITSFNPFHGPAGTTTTISGSGFLGATSVKFNGVSASSFTVVNDTTITATCPNGATSGAISVTNASGTGSLASYVPSNIAIRRSGAWVWVMRRIRRSGAWIYPTIYIRRSNAWVRVQ